MATCVLAGAVQLYAGPDARAQAPTLEVGVSEPTGRFEVGTRELELVDRSRIDTPGSPGDRRLMVQATYPRDGGRSRECEPSRYISPLVQPILMRAIALDRAIDVTSGICRGGRIARGKRPLLIFSHAYTADRFVYGALINDLASRGYVVLAIDHPPDAFAIEYPGGRLVEGEHGRPLAAAEITAQELGALTELRAADARFVLSKAVTLDRRESGFLAGHLDRRRVGVLGHSLGGSTAARAAQLDPRFDAAVDIDGSLFGDWTSTLGSTTPFMLLAAEGAIGSNFTMQPLCSYMVRLGGPKFAFVLAHAQHFSFSDFQSLAPQIAQADPLWAFALLFQAAVGTIDPETSIRAQRTALAVFFDRYVKAKPGAPEPAADGAFAELPIAGCSG